MPPCNPFCILNRGHFHTVKVGDISLWYVLYVQREPASKPEVFRKKSGKRPSASERMLGLSRLYTGGAGKQEFTTFPHQESAWTG